MREQFTFYRSFYEAIRSIKNQKERLAIYDAIAAYALNEEEPKLVDLPAAIFTLIRPTLDASKRKAENGKKGGKSEASEKQTESKTEANAKQNGSKVEAKSKQIASEKENENEKEKEREIENECYSARARFVPPTVEEVAAYCFERGNGVDAEQFVAFYASKGWRVGNQPMKDWKQAVITWEKRDRPRQKSKSDDWRFEEL